MSIWMWTTDHGIDVLANQALANDYNHHASDDDEVVKGNSDDVDGDFYRRDCQWACDADFFLPLVMLMMILMPLVMVAMLMMMMLLMVMVTMLMMMVMVMSVVMVMVPVGLARSGRVRGMPCNLKGCNY